MTDPWADRAFLRGTQYKTDANLAARQSIYAYQHPRIDLAARVLDLAAPAPSDASWTSAAVTACTWRNWRSAAARDGSSGLTCPSACSLPPAAG